MKLLFVMVTLIAVPAFAGITPPAPVENGFTHCVLSASLQNRLLPEQAGPRETKPRSPGHVTENKGTGLVTCMKRDGSVTAAIPVTVKVDGPNPATLSGDLIVAKIFGDNAVRPDKVAGVAAAVELTPIQPPITEPQLNDPK